MIGVFGGEKGHGHLAAFEDGCQAVRLSGVVGVVRDVEDEEWGNAFVRLNVVDCGKAEVVFGGEAKLFAVPERCLGLVMDAPSGFGGFDDGGDVVGVAIDGQATDEVGE